MEVERGKIVQAMNMHTFEVLLDADYKVIIHIPKVIATALHRQLKVSKQEELLGREVKVDFMNHTVYAVDRERKEGVYCVIDM